MTSQRLIRALGALLLLSLQTSPARATHHADFLNTADQPTITFNKGTLTWTLRNRAVSRTIRYNSKTGSLVTTEIADLKNHRVIHPDPASEGQISFLAPLMEPPVPIVKGWKTTDAAPPTDWTQPEFNDGAWKPATLPAADSDSPRWFRYRIPPGRMLPNHAYAFLLDHAASGDIEVYIDGVPAEKLRADELPETRSLQYDLPARSRVVAIRVSGRRASLGSSGCVSVVEEGSAPPSLDLSNNWKYMVHSTDLGEGASRFLTISLSGTGQHEGMDLDVNYQIYPGDEPFLVKWFMFTSHRQSRFLMEKAVVEHLPIPGANPDIRRYPKTGFVACDAASRDGLFAMTLSPVGNTETDADGKAVSTVLRPFSLLKTDMRQVTGKSVIGLFHGTAATGAFLCQLYSGQYLSHATPTSVPPLYNTRLGYGTGITAAACERLIPLVAAAGIKLFVIDDGWQANIGDGNGRYGDWMTDKSHFPQGLLPISTLVRERNMRFGLWAAPTAVEEKSQAESNAKEWLVRRPDGSRFRPLGSTEGMCFTTGWEENFTKSIEVLCRELFVTYLQMDGGLLADSCSVPTHDHPLTRSVQAQWDHWAAFNEKIRKVDPSFVLSRGGDFGPESADLQDQARALTPEIIAAATQTDAAGAYRLADLTRRALLPIAWARPSFALTGIAAVTAPAADKDALEYQMASGAAIVGNMELHGKLDALSLDERGIVQKWVQWNQDNRPWLAFTQPLTFPQDGVDGVLHLRNSLNGRYGYVCLWNGSSQPVKPVVSFRPADYLVRLEPGDALITRLKDGKPVRISGGNEITLSDLTLAPHSWEILEIRQKGRSASAQ